MNSGGVADLTSEAWQTEVEVNPLYAWFMAGLTPADPGTGMCSTYNTTKNIYSWIYPGLTFLFQSLLLQYAVTGI